MVKTTQVLTISAITAVGLLTFAAILPALMQEVYAPTSRRGMWQADAELSPVMANQNPYASPYMIVYCDDVGQLQGAYKDWKAKQIDSIAI